MVFPKLQAKLGGDINVQMKYSFNPAICLGFLPNSVVTERGIRKKDRFDSCFHRCTTARF